MDIGLKKNAKQSDFDNLVKLKIKMKSFLEKEESIRKQMDKETNQKKFIKLQKELDKHLSSFPIIEENLVREEKKMLNPERGLYKGIAINVRDKDYKKFPLYLKYANMTNHVGYTGTTRVGKTKNMISDAVQLINKKDKNGKYEWDVIIVDPKGGEGQEILTEVVEASLKSNRAEDFRYLSPAFAKESEKINLMYGMNDEEGASLIRSFAESVSDDDFFNSVVYENTLAVLKALSFIQLATDPTGEYTKILERQELSEYIKLKTLKDVDAETVKDAWNRTLSPNELLVVSKDEKKSKKDTNLLKNISESFYQNRSMVNFKILSNYITFKSLMALKMTITEAISIPPVEHVGHEKHLEIIKLKNEALSILEKVLSTDELNFSKISKTHSVLLSQLVYGDIGEVFGGVGINPIANRLLADKQGLISVMQPYPMKYKNVSNVSVMAVLKSIESMMGLIGTSGRSNKRRLAIMIDEAGAVMYKGIENLFNKAGGLGVTMFVYTQSYEDYSLTLGETNANVIIDNVNTVITMRMNHPESCKNASESIGTIRKHQSMYMSSMEGSSRFSVSNDDEPIALPEDIFYLPVGVGYMRHNGETYYVDFPYVKGLNNYPIDMPILESEKSRRELSEYEINFTNELQTIKEVK